MNVVLDTNVIVSASISLIGAPAHILAALTRGEYRLLVSEAILAEYEKVLKYRHISLRHGHSTREVSAIINGLRASGTMVQTKQPISAVTEDPDDNKFLECAVAGEADYIVSGDAHLLALRQYEGTQILSSTVFLAFLSHS